MNIYIHIYMYIYYAYYVIYIYIYIYIPLNKDIENIHPPSFCIFYNVCWHKV